MHRSLLVDDDTSFQKSGQSMLNPQSEDSASFEEDNVDVATLVDEVLRKHLRLIYFGFANKAEPRERNAPIKVRRGLFTEKPAQELGVALVRILESDAAKAKVLSFRDDKAREILDAGQDVRLSSTFDLVFYGLLILSKWLDVVDLHPHRRAVISFIVKLAGASSQLPTSLFIHGVSMENSSSPWRVGGFGEIFRGTRLGAPIVAKRLRGHTARDPALRSVSYT